MGEDKKYDPLECEDIKDPNFTKTEKKNIALFIAGMNNIILLNKKNTLLNKKI